MVEPEQIVVPKVIKDAQNKPAFDYDCVTQIDGVEPLAKTFEDFDWPGLESALGELEQHLDGETDYQKLGEALCVLLTWIAADTHTLDFVGRKAIALLWVVRPGFFGGRSAASLARSLGIRSTSHFAELCGQISRRFGGIRNRSQQAHASNFKRAETIKIPTAPKHKQVLG